MSDDKAAEARSRLLGSLAGRAKEVTGAVTGSDDLVEEGQLQQVEARKRKITVAEEAIADAERQEAAEEVRVAARHASDMKSAAHAAATREKSAVERQREAEHARADRAAELQETVGEEAAEARAALIAESGLRAAAAITVDAAVTEEHAATEKRRLEAEAAAAEQEAAKLRAQATNEGSP